MKTKEKHDSNQYDNLSDDKVENELTRSKRTRKEKSFGDDFYTYFVSDDPLTYNDAIISIDASFWKDAINTEIESIMANHT